MTTPEDKRIKKKLKRFLKQHKQFKEVPDLDSCDIVLIFEKAKLNAYYLVVRNDFREEPPPNSDDSCVVFYLKNTNPHDGRKSTRGYISRVSEKSRFCSLTK